MARKKETPKRARKRPGDVYARGIRMGKRLEQARSRVDKVTLPALHVGIYDNGKLLKVELMADPRIVFCNTFNANCSYLGLTARPILRKRKGVDYALAVLGIAKPKGGAA